MFDLTEFSQYTLGGKSFISNRTTSKNGFEGKEVSIPIAWAGVLTVRTDANTGSLTMADVGHLITTAAKVDIYWTNADGTLGSRRGVTVGTVAALVVPIDLGAGDDLPIATTVVQVALVKSYVVSINGDALTALLAAVDNARGTIVLMSGTDTVEELAIVLASGQIYAWTGTGANPIVGDTIDAVHFTHADTAAVHNVRIGAQLNT